MAAKTISDPTGFVTGNFYAGMSPCVAYFDARKISVTRTETLSWNFGDAADTRIDPRTAKAVDSNKDLTSQVVAHYYNHPGTFKATCTVHHANGQTSSYSFTVTVDPDTRQQVWFAGNGSDAGDGSQAHPWLSAAKFQQVAAFDNIHINMLSTKMVLTNSVTLGKNTVINGGLTTTICPVLAGGVGFVGVAGKTSDILIKGIIFDGGGATNQAARIRGSRFAIMDSTLGHIGRGFEVADSAANCILFMGIIQPVGTSVASQCIYIGNGTRIIEQFNTLTGSVNESPNRSTGGPISGWTIEYCDYSQPAQSKASCTRRAGTDGTIANSKFTTEDLSLNVGVGDIAAGASVTIMNTVIRNCSMDFKGLGTLALQAGVIGCTVINNTIHRDNGPCITVVVSTPGLKDLSDIVLKNNVCTGTIGNARFSQINGTCKTIETSGNTFNGKAC